MDLELRMLHHISNQRSKHKTGSNRSNGSIIPDFGPSRGLTLQNAPDLRSEPFSSQPANVTAERCPTTAPNGIPFSPHAEQALPAQAAAAAHRGVVNVRGGGGRQQPEARKQQPAACRSDHHTSRRIRNAAAELSAVQLSASLWAKTDVDLTRAPFFGLCVCA